MWEWQRHTTDMPVSAIAAAAPMYDPHWTMAPQSHDPLRSFPCWVVETGHNTAHWDKCIWGLLFTLRGAQVGWFLLTWQRLSRLRVKLSGKVTLFKTLIKFLFSNKGNRSFLVVQWRQRAMGQGAGDKLGLKAEKTWVSFKELEFWLSHGEERKCEIF